MTDCKSSELTKNAYSKTTRGLAILKWAIRVVTRLIFVVASIVGTLLAYQRIGRAAFIETTFLSFGNYSIFSYKHQNATTLYDTSVIFAVSDWDSVTFNPYWAPVTMTPNSIVTTGNIHFWENNYFASYGATWGGLYQPFIYVGSTLTQCYQFPNGSWMPACASNRPYYANIRLNTSKPNTSTPTSTERLAVTRHEIGHLYGLAHNGCLPYDFPWALTGVMANQLSCSNATTYIVQHEANTANSLFP